MNIQELVKHQPVVAWVMPGGDIQFVPILRVPLPTPIELGDVIRVQASMFPDAVVLEYDVVGQRADGLVKLRRRG